MQRKILALAGIAVLLSCSAPVFAGDQDFTLVNQTGVTIDQLYVSPHSADDWQEDVLGQDVLENDAELEITFSRDTEECSWDLMVVDSEGTKITWEKIDLCKYVTITLHLENGKAWAEFAE